MDLSTYLVIGTANTGGRPLNLVVQNAVKGGVRAIQLREKNLEGQTLDAGDIYLNAIALRDAIDKTAPENPPLLIINDRIDVALALHLNGVRVDGVHIGQQDLPADAVRQMLKRAGWHDAIIGLSCRDERALDAAAEFMGCGAIDYIGIGPVHTTSSKPNMPAGLEYARWQELCEYVKGRAPKLVVVAIGGITPSDAAPLRAAGADGYCCISYIAGAKDVENNTKKFVKAWHDAENVKG
jgi:thiamine-phosphate pyrophosphorylase